MSVIKQKREVNKPTRFNLVHVIRRIYSDPKLVIILITLLIGTILVGRYALDAISMKKMESDSSEISIAALQTLNPLEEQNVKYCQHSKFKFEKGLLTCTIEKFFIFDVQNMEEALNLSEEIGRNLANDYLVTKYVDDSSTNRTLESFAVQHTSNCSVSTRYYPEATREVGIPGFPWNSDIKGLMVYSSCSRQVLKEYYPLITTLDS